MLRRLQVGLDSNLASVRACRHPRLFSSNNLLDELNARGLIAQTTSPELANALRKPITLYCGVDPTAPSLHVGNLVALMNVLHFHVRGHHVLPLVGGATGAVGDPGGRTTERALMATDTINANKTKLADQLGHFFRLGTERARTFVDIDKQQLVPPKILDNLSWTGHLTLLDFLRDVGKHSKVNVMLARDSVKTRLETSQGISFTEFSYQLLQAHDFFHLYTNHGCQLQVGGADQWGNIVAGIDLIKRRRSMLQDELDHSEPDPAYGLTVPLLTTASGEKFGKSAGNAVWLNPEMTSVLDFYQYFVRQPDTAVDKLLRIFTFMPLSQIEQVMNKHEEDTSKRHAQRVLAHEATSLVHGETLAYQAVAASRVLYESDIHIASLSTFKDALRGDRRLLVLPRSKMSTTPLSNLLVEGGLMKSKAQADQLAKQGGLQLNGSREPNPRRMLRESDFINGEFVVVRKGNDHLVLGLENEE